MASYGTRSISRSSPGSSGAGSDAMIEGSKNYPAGRRLLLQFAVPIEIVHPALVQIVGREQAAVLVQVVYGRLVGLGRWPHARDRRQHVGFLQVAVGAGRDHVLPGREAALGAGNDVVESEVLALAAI